jgi:hypothetical protein
MFGTRRLICLSALALAASLVPLGAAERLPGPRGTSLTDPPQARKKRWRPYVFVSCPKCDGLSAPVTVYAEHDGGEPSYGFKEGRYRADKGGLGNEVGNDNISSLLVMEGFMARLCQHEGDGRGAGRCEDFGPGEHELSEEMDNQTSFVWVWTPVRRSN